MPGLDSLLTYLQSKCATVNAIQHGIHNVNNTINTEIQNLQTEINNIEISNPGTGDIGKESHYHTSHTDFMLKGIPLIMITETHSASKPLFHISKTI